MGLRRRGRIPTPLPEPYAAVLDRYAVDLDRADMTPQARRTYLSRVRVYLAWLACTGVDGDPLSDPAAAAWAARDYKAHLHGVLKRAPATVNAALAAVSDLALRRGLGKLDGTTVARLDLPARRAPKALTGRDDIRWQRAAQAAPPRDRALAAAMRFAGARIAEAVGLDLDDLPATQRRRRLRIRGKGRKNRFVPVHPELAAAPDAWLAVRRTWAAAKDNPAVFLNRNGARISLRTADEIIGTIARTGGLADLVTPHVLRHSFATDLIRAGTDVVTVAELLGHASLDSTRIYTLPSDDDLNTAIGRLTVDR
jgi:integrase/recombinase XerC